MYITGQMGHALSLGFGVLWGNREVLYQDLPFEQHRQHEVQMTQFEQGYLHPKGWQNELCSTAGPVGKFFLV